MQEYRIKIAKMTCINCSNAIEKLTQKINGVANASVSYVNGSGVFLIENEKVKAQIKEKIKALGYEFLQDEENLQEFKKKELKTLKYNFFLSLTLSVTAMALMLFFENFTATVIQLFLGLLGIFYCGRSFFIHAFKGLKNGALDMNTLVSLGTIFAFLYSFLAFLEFFEAPLYFAEGSMIITFVLFGKLLEQRAQFKAMLYEHNFTHQTQKARLVLENGDFKELNAAFLQAGDNIFVKEGEGVSVDGIVLEGRAEVDMSAINGEFVPIIKQKGDNIEAGALILNGALKIRATQKAMDSKIELIKDMIFKASAAKMPINAFVDKIAAYFVGTILALASLVFVFWAVKEGLSAAFLHSSAFLLISCPCALGLATPIALVLALNNAAKNAILIKNPAVLELLPRIKYALFDKTGTLTKNDLSIYAHNLEKEDFMLLSSIENLSSHPISQAFKQGIKLENLPEFIPARGIKYTEKAQCYLAGNEALLKDEGIEIPQKTQEFLAQSSLKAPVLVYFAKNKLCLGVVCLENELRKEALELLSFLKHRGIKNVILSGDSEKNVAQKARELGVDEYKGALKPEAKLEFLKKYQKKGACLFVGDGINDAASLAAADIGIAMNSASFLAQSSGDIILLKDDLNALKYLLELAQKSFSIIKQNLFWAFFYNSLCLPIAAGFVPFITLSPHLAALAMCASSFFVVMNSLRLKYFKC